MYLLKSPCIPAVAYSRLAAKVNSCEQMLKTMSSKMVSYETNFPSLSSRNDENHATVIISKVSPDLSNPTKRRQALEQVCGHE